MSSLERDERKSHSGPLPDFLGTAGFQFTLWAAFECRAKTPLFDPMDMKTMSYKNSVEKNPS